MGDLHLVLPALNLSVVDAAILIMVQQVGSIMFSLKMVDYPMSFLSLSTWIFFGWQLLKDFIVSSWPLWDYLGFRTYGNFVGALGAWGLRIRSHGLTIIYVFLCHWLKGSDHMEKIYKDVRISVVFSLNCFRRIGIMKSWWGAWGRGLNFFFNIMNKDC